MPADLRLLTLQLWAQYQAAKLAHLEQFARRLKAQADGGEVIEFPVEYLARYL